MARSRWDAAVGDLAVLEAINGDDVDPGFKKSIKIINMFLNYIHNIE